MEDRTIRPDIFAKITANDKKRKSNIATAIAQKIQRADTPYTRGVIHGICFALMQEGVITHADATDILALVQEV